MPRSGCGWGCIRGSRRRANGDYVAYAVHQAARIVGAAHGGQVLVSAEAAERAGPSLETVELVSLGRFRVRDFDGPVELLQAVGIGLDPRRLAPRALPAEGHNLVRPLTRFIGRTAELLELTEAVVPGALLTIVGPGGLGKTRLVTEWGLASAAEWPDGVWMVELAAVETPEQVAAAMAAAVGAEVGRAADPLSELCELWKDRRCVLIVDNCEHVVDRVGGLVQQLLRRCPGVAVLATSRTPLGVAGEAVWRVDPLEADDDGVRLFVERARLARRGFDIDDATRIDIAHICRRLDGLPLAIELAAARCAHLTPSEILAGLSEGHLRMPNRDRTATGRQRTLASLLDWSWRLLDGSEQDAFAALAVFAGSFSPGAAAAAVAAVAGEDQAEELVWSLVDKSLVQADSDADGTRLRLLETIRSYARNRPGYEASAGMVASALARHFVGRFGDELGDIDRVRRDERRTEVENVRALLPHVMVPDEELAQALACIVLAEDGTGSSTVLVDEGLGYLRRLPGPSPHRLALLARVCDSALNGGQDELGARLLEEAIELRSVVGGDPPWDEGHIEQIEGLLAIAGGDSDAARRIALGAVDRMTSATGARGRSTC